VRTRFIFSFIFLLALLAGCRTGEDTEKAEHGYVVAPQVALRDRVAAVFNKVGFVNNGERVRVLDRSQNRRFVKVRTEDGKEGWMEQRYLVGQSVYDGFAKLGREHANAPSQAQAVTRRPVNLHVGPARNAETLYQLKEGSKLELLERASTPKSGIKKPVANTEDEEEKKKDRGEEDEPAKPAAAPAPQRSAKGSKVQPATAAPADPLEDWWLVRDSEKHVGWMLGRMLDIEIPLEIAQYAEGQRIIAAFVLNEVAGKAPGEKHAQYAVLLSEPKDGMPFDFNQVRIFTWNAARNRYETAHRERVIGHLPFKVGKEEFGKEGLLPTFAMTIEEKGGNRAERRYKMNGPIVRKITPPAAEGQKKSPESTKKTAGRSDIALWKTAIQSVMAEKVNKLKLERDYKKYLYFIDGQGNVCRKAKSGEGESEILEPKAVERDNNYLYFIDKDGDVARSQRAVRGANKGGSKKAA